MSYPTWDEWIHGLDDDRRAEVEQLLELFQRLGAIEPHGRVRSQVQEGIPQLARFLVLRRLWSGAIDGWATVPRSVENVPAARRLLDAGANREDLIRAMRVAAYEATFATLYDIGFGVDGDLDDDLIQQLPGWRLIEIDRSGEPTGRVVAALYEDLLTMDPSGRDGADLWE